MGIEIALEEMFERFVGKSMSRCLELIEELFGQSVPDGFVEEYRYSGYQSVEVQSFWVEGMGNGERGMGNGILV